METKSERKIDITKKILEVKDDSILDKIEELLTETETVAYKTNGEALNRDQYKKHIEKISNDINKSGIKSYTSEEIRDYVTSRKR